MAFDYTFSGEKIKKLVTGTPEDDETRLYLGGVEYKDGQAETYYHGEGRVLLTDGTPRFQYKISDPSKGGQAPRQPGRLLRGQGRRWRHQGRGGHQRPERAGGLAAAFLLSFRDEHGGRLGDAGRCGEQLPVQRQGTVW